VAGVALRASGGRALGPKDRGQKRAGDSASQPAEQCPSRHTTGYGTRDLVYPLTHDDSRAFTPFFNWTMVRHPTVLDKTLICASAPGQSHEKPERLVDPGRHSQFGYVVSRLGLRREPRTTMAL